MVNICYLIKGVAKEVKKYQYIFIYTYINNDYFSGETQVKSFLPFRLIQSVRPTPDIGCISIHTSFFPVCAALVQLLLASHGHQIAWTL